MSRQPSGALPSGRSGVIASTIVNWPRLWIVSLATLVTSCVPNESSDSRQPYAIAPPTVQKWRPHPVTRGPAIAQPVADPTALEQDKDQGSDALLTLPFTEHFSNATLGSHWRT
ncbi:MAG TPA: hypothetical protein VIV60_03500, partial [Polyangiaceae bacterium]